MNEESEFDDIELDAVALAAVAGGQHRARWLLTYDNPQRLQSSPLLQSQRRSRKSCTALFTSDPDAARQRMVALAAEQGVTLTVEQVREFLQQMDEDSEFDDIELDAVALAAIAGGRCS